MMKAKDRREVCYPFKWYERMKRQKICNTKTKLEAIQIKQGDEAHLYTNTNLIWYLSHWSNHHKK